MSLWMDYSKDEVRFYHPLCEAACNRALKISGLDGQYEIVHHEMTDSLEMDFVVKNKITGSYLCVIEVKRTPQAIKSMRCQYQAQSYVVNSFGRMEQPYFVVTNLEYSYAFRYDASKKSVASQMLFPGLLKNMRFDEAPDENTFIDALSRHFLGILKNFSTNSYEYMATPERFEKFLNRAVDDKKAWKSGLAQLLYEYIRGALDSSGNILPINPVVSFRGNMSLVCHSGQRLGFERIFDSDREKFYSKYSLLPDFLEEMYAMGRQDIGGDMAADMIFNAASRGDLHGGAVATDTELGDVAAALVKSAGGGRPFSGLLCDPAAGSGSLLCSVARGLKTEPQAIWANDINEGFVELLELRCGLLFPHLAGKGSGPRITASDVASWPDNALENVSAIVTNPPFLSGVHSALAKRPFTDRVFELTGEPSVFEGKMAGFECVFLELLCTLAKEGTVCACILPKTHLGARGRAAVDFRRLLLKKFGLQYIFDYPREGLFEKVVKDTCIAVGTIGRPCDTVQFISSAIKISEINIRGFEEKLKAVSGLPGFSQILYGVDLRGVPSEELERGLNSGWNMVSCEFEEVAAFIREKFENCHGLMRLGELEDFRGRFKRGKNNNEGAKELLFIDLNDALHEEVKQRLCELAPGIANADKSNRSMDVGAGFCHFLKTEGMSDDDIAAVVAAYERHQDTGKKQIKKVKSAQELSKLLWKEQGYAFAPWHVLIPRTIRRYAQVYYISQETYVSTNFFCLNMENEKNTIVAATWMCTVFYQLLCEFYQKDQEGARKLERRQLADTYIPDGRIVGQKDYERLAAALPGIEFLDFNHIELREIDKIWSELLWGGQAPKILDEALFHLERLAAKRMG